MTSFIPRFKGLVFGGDIVADDEKSYRLYLASLEGKQVEAVVQAWRQRRTDRQHRFYRAYLNLIADETGNDANDLHSLFKKKFLPVMTREVMGEIVEIDPTTTKMERKDFSDYLEKISALTNMPLPDPNKWIEKWQTKTT